MENTTQKTLFFGKAIAEVARSSGYPYVTVWRHAKKERVISAEAARRYYETSNISLSELRPDLWPAPEDVPHAPEA